MAAPPPGPPAPPAGAVNDWADIPTWPLNAPTPLGPFRNTGPAQAFQSGPIVLDGVPQVCNNTRCQWGAADAAGIRKVQCRSKCKVAGPTNTPTAISGGRRRPTRHVRKNRKSSRKNKKSRKASRKNKKSRKASRKNRKASRKNKKSRKASRKN